MTAGEPLPPDAVILVTGASSGIGRATASRLSRPGVRLVLAARGEASLQDTADECRAKGASTLVVPTDVTDPQAVEDLFAAAVDRFGRIDAVVHSVAVLAYGRFEEVPVEVFDHSMRVTLTGAANVLRTSLARMRLQGGGRIVVVGSILGKIAVPYMSTYITAKWALHGLVRTAQIETRHEPQIQLSLVSPGGVNTPVYTQAGSYLGWHGRPPPPLVPPERVAAAVESVLCRPRRERYVGLASPAVVWAFRLAPAVFDRLAPTLMERLAISTEAVGPSSGNVFASRPEGNTTVGPWERSVWGQARTVVGSLRTERSRRGRPLTEAPVDRKKAAVSPEVDESQLTEVRREISASADAVWSVLADGWMYAAWVVGTSRVRDVDESWPRTGSQLQHSAGVWPMMLNDSTTVLHSEVGRELVLQPKGWPLGEARVHIRLEPGGDGKCTVSIVEDAVAGPGRLPPRPVRQRLIAVRNVEALRRLAYLAEGRAR